MVKVVDFNKNRPRPKHDAIYLIKRKNKLTSEQVTLLRQRAKVILLDFGGWSSHDSAWCMLIARKGKFYLAEYTCPFTKIFLREWIHENFIDTLGEPWL